MISQVVGQVDLIKRRGALFGDFCAVKKSEKCLEIALKFTRSCIFNLAIRKSLGFGL